MNTLAAQIAPFVENRGGIPAHVAMHPAPIPGPAHRTTSKVARLLAQGTSHAPSRQVQHPFPGLPHGGLEPRPTGPGPQGGPSPELMMLLMQLMGATQHS